MYVCRGSFGAHEHIGGSKKSHIGEEHEEQHSRTLANNK